MVRMHFPSYLGYIGIAFVASPLKIETSPVFYRRVFDDPQGGSAIRGHFGIPFPAANLIGL